MTYKTLGIILKRTNFSEADRIISIFTRDRGKIRVLAKGVRRTLSKLAGHLEPFCLTQFVIAEGRNLDIITAAEVKKCHFELRSNLEATRNAYYLAEITEKMTPENEKHPEIFDLLDETLENLNTHPADLLSSYFEFKILSHIGLAPELFDCILCDEKLLPVENYFNFTHGGVSCSSCGGDRSISPEAVKILRLFLEIDLAQIDKINVSTQILNEIKSITDEYIRYNHTQEFKSKRFLGAK